MFLPMLHKRDTKTLKPFIKANECQIGTPINIKEAHEYVHKNISHFYTNVTPTL